MATEYRLGQGTFFTKRELRSSRCRLEGRGFESRTIHLMYIPVGLNILILVLLHVFKICFL